MNIYIVLVCVWVLSCFSCMLLFVTSWTVARQAPLSMRFSRHEYWSGLPCPPPGHLPNPGIETALHLILKREMATHSSIAWRILWTEEPGGLLPIESHRVGHDWSDLACMHALEKEMAAHSSVLAWRIPGTEEPDGLPSMGLHRVRRDLAAAAAGLLR